MDQILLDYRIRSHTPVAGFELVRRSVLVPGRSSWNALEQNAEAEFWENRRLLEQVLDAVPRYLFDRAGFWAWRISSSRTDCERSGRVRSVMSRRAAGWNRLLPAGGAEAPGPWTREPASV